VKFQEIKIYFTNPPATDIGKPVNARRSNCS